MRLLDDADLFRAVVAERESNDVKRRVEEIIDGVCTTKVAATSALRDILEILESNMTKNLLWVLVPPYLKFPLQGPDETKRTSRSMKHEEIEFSYPIPKSLEHAQSLLRDEQLMDAIRPTERAIRQLASNSSTIVRINKRLSELLGDDDEHV